MKHILLQTLLILTITLNSSCEEQKINDSTGNDTFSCYINGKKYIPSAGTAIGGGNNRPFAWSYSNLNDPKIPYFFKATTGGNDYTLTILITNPEVGKNILNEELIHQFEIDHSGMIVLNSKEFYNTRNNQENGFVHFTELSKTKAVGTFECTLYDENGKDLKVTNGKFNLSLDSKKN